MRKNKRKNETSKLQIDSEMGKAIMKSQTTTFNFIEVWMNTSASIIETKSNVVVSYQEISNKIETIEMNLSFFLPLHKIDNMIVSINVNDRNKRVSCSTKKKKKSEKM